MSIFPKLNTYVDNEISRMILDLKAHEVDSDEYGTTLERLGKLHKMRQEEKPDRVRSDTLVTVAANLVGIAMIIRHEEFYAVTSKALSFIRMR